MSVTYGAGGSTRDRTIEHRHAASRPTTASRRWRTSPASGAHHRELREILDRDAAARHRERARAARRPARRARRVAPRPGRPAATRASWSSADPRARYDVLRSAPRASPRRTPTPTAPRTTCATCKEKVDAGARLPDHAAVLRQRRRTSTSSSARAASGIDVPIIPGIMPITNVAQIKRFTAHVRRDDPRARCCGELELRAGRAGGGRASSASRYATLQCAELLAAARPASTSTR